MVLNISGVFPCQQEHPEWGEKLGLGWNWLRVFVPGVPSTAWEGEEEEEEDEGWAVPGAQLPSGSLITPGTASRVTLGCKSH